jgi:hypothetical protein
VALPSIRNSFAEDDVWVVEGRSALQHPRSLGAVLTEPYWPRTFGGKLWRPVVLTSYALDYRITDSPHWFHAVNVLWAAAAAAILALLATLLAGPRVGLATGLLFAVHPVHVEATAGVVGRSELMAAAACGVALLCALRAPRARAWWLAGVALASAFAVGSKESGAMLPLVLLLVLTYRGESLRAAALPALCSAAPIALYFVLRAVVTTGAFNTGGVAPGLEGLSLAQRAPAMLGVSLEWWRLLLVPARLAADYSPAQLEAPITMTSRHWMAAALWLGACAAALRFRSRVPGLALGLCWVVVTVLPVANVLVPTEILVAERTLFLPSWGAAFAAASVGALLPWSREAKWTLLGVVLAAGALLSVLRTDAWRDPEHWYSALQVDAPKSYRTLWLRGNEAFRDNHWGGGERLLRQAMRAAPGIPGPAEDLARYYATARLWPQAEDMLKKAMPLNWMRSRPWLLLDGVMLQRGDTARALAWAMHTAARFPDDAEVAEGALGVLLAARRCNAADTLLNARGAQLTPVARTAARQRVASCKR